MWDLDALTICLWKYWLSNTLKPLTSLPTLLLYREFASVSCHYCFGRCTLIFLFIGQAFTSPSWGQCTALMEHLSWSKPGMHTKDRKANMVGSVKSSMYKHYTRNKTSQQLWRYTGIKHLMCWEETKYFEIWIHDSFIQLNILLYHFKRYHWHQPHHSNGKSDFYAKRELI